MSLLIHRAERADHLVEALGTLLADPLPDPFATEIVSVPTPGVERWLSQRLSARLGTRPGRTDGVCAGVDFCSPRRLVARALSGTDATAEEDDPWRPGQVVWPLLSVIDDARGEPWAKLLWAHLDGRAGRRWSVARHQAELFAAYAAGRPAMLQAWSEHRDVDPAGHPLGPDRAWQAELWRRLRAAVEVPEPGERVAAAVRVLRERPEAGGLPARLSVFGATRIEPDHLAVLTALAAHRDVHLWLPHPSPALWRRVADHRARTGPPAGPRRVDDATEELVRHRLLAYLGRDARELQLGLLATGADLVDGHLPSPDPPPPTLLGRLQADIAGDAAPRPPADRPLLAAEDRSVVLHAAHGPDRQVEVLREVLVGLLADDPTLEPRDIVVMCPDIETFAPLIAAAFGLDTAETEAEHPGHRLRVRLADRSLRQLNPLLAVVSRLVGLADGRMPASAVLDLCATAPVARKFGLTAEDQDRLQDLVARAGVRWGLDADRRGRFGLADFGQNTWAAGLDRLLLGVAMDETEQRFIGTALPMDDVDSSDVDLVGRLAELVGRLRTLTDACRTPRPALGWVDLFKQALDLLTEVAGTDRWQLGHAYGELSRLAEAAGGSGPTLALSDVADLLADAFRGRASRSNFRTGTLTVASLLPMRAVPHRVVCLLGVDDGVFPRRRRPDGDDITAADPWVGDRDSRSEDRQLLLDAVMAAEERLLVVYAGADPRSGAVIPPAVPIGELLDALDVTARTVDGAPVRDAVTVRHPLQPFDPRNFAPGRPDGPPSLSFDAGALRGVRAAASPERRPPPAVFDPAPLPALAESGLVELTDLVRFFGHPVRALLRDRGGLYLRGEDEQPDEQIPAQLQGLERWAVGDRMLRLHLQGQELGRLRDAEWRRGAVPPRMLGAAALGQLVEEVEDVATSAGEYLVGEPQRHEVDAVLPGEVRLTGTVGGVRGDHLVRVGFSRLSAKHRLTAWLELLALTATDPSRPWQAVAIGTRGRSRLGPVSGTFAATLLADLVELRRSGLTEPLPFAARTSAHYAGLRQEGQTLGREQLRELEKTWGMDRDPAYEAYFGAGVTLAALLDQPSRPAEVRGNLGEDSRFGTLARRVFTPLLTREVSA